ncbi:hypothetical protein [Engelhardtia mirabilis]|uniref:Uncharacterized protein n=1 Tax=Engelhardtia mirabilis TaxID=2528011 RepID=A0A518BR11_9BACT|nr:hypothetical protein Pla133_45340 [Planctomycetes bacterium Pla133]QDV03740.1 hypothetical protein Pla86_45320 [Planctomycetes bacterium Pla86]
MAGGSHATIAAFGVESLAGQVTLERHYGPLVAADRSHRIGRASWLAAYVFVAVKLGWILRPLVGDPLLPTVYLREEAFDENPYLLILFTALGFAAAALKALLGG